MKNSILIITEFFYPAYKAGGPTKSIFNLVNVLQNKYDIKIICSSKDLGSSKNLDVIKMNEWIECDQYKIIYCTNFFIAIKNILISRVSLNYKFLYVGSFFNPIYSIFPVILHLGSKKKIIIAPKGEFFKGAMLQKNYKKLFVINILKPFLKILNIRWHATNEVEKKTIEDTIKFSESKIVVSSNLITINKSIKSQKHSFKENNQLNILICGRISPVKNITMSLDCVMKLKGKIKVDIWGQVDDMKYWDLCLKKIYKMPKNIFVSYKGTFHPNNIKQIFHGKDLLLMPSLSENFGYAIFEAFSFGVPVITSKNTPWIDLNKKGVGFDVDILNKEKFIKCLQYFEKLNDVERQDIREKCKNFAFHYALKNTNKNKKILQSHLFI